MPYPSDETVAEQFKKSFPREDEDGYRTLTPNVFRMIIEDMLRIRATDRKAIIELIESKRVKAPEPPLVNTTIEERVNTVLDSLLTELKKQ